MPPRPHLLVTALQLGQLLQSARKHLRLTQAQLGAQLCLSQNRISHLEQHPEEISIKQLLTWTAVLHLDLHISERQAPKPLGPSEW